MSANPSFAATPKQAYNQISAANANRDGTGTTYLIVSGAAGGSRIERIRVRATGTTTAGVVRLYLSLDAGVTKRLLEEIMVAAIVPAAAVQIFEGDVVFPGGLQLPNANAQIYASTLNAEIFNVFAEGGDY
jgi:hypothetical protein